MCRPLPTVFLVALTLSLAIAADASRPSFAATFDPQLEIAIVDPSPGLPSDFSLEFDLGSTDVQLARLVTFLPPEWTVAPAQDVPLGAIVGFVETEATLGLTNAPCNTPLPVEFTMLNAGIDITDTVSFDDPDENGDDDWTEDKDGNRLFDGVDKYPEFLNRIFDVDNLQPIRRSAGLSFVAGIPVLLQFLIFEPGTLIDESIPDDPALGYPTFTTLQAAGDPGSDPEPSPITDSCTPLTTLNRTFGLTRDNACTRDDLPEDLPAVCTVNSAVLLECDDFRDNDGDGFVNDGCPQIGPESEAVCDNKQDDDSDGWINDGCPAVDEAADPDIGWDLGAPGPAEDSTRTNPDDGNVTLFVNPPEGEYAYTVIGIGQRDADLDGLENGLDTCPFDVNVGSPRVIADGDLDQDGLDVACDPNDGETRSDQDNDGYPNRQDNCPLIPNGRSDINPATGMPRNQRDHDLDGIGDVCDPSAHTPNGYLTYATCTGEIAIAADTTTPASAASCIQPPFLDVAPGHWANEFIGSIFDAEITLGCSADPPLYCPADPVTRAQMAAFILRAMEEANNLPSFQGTFDDVAQSDWFSAFVVRLYQLGITTGCSADPLLYCPHNPVTRAQMAVLLIRALDEDPIDPPTGNVFPDVTANHWAAGYIERLFQLGITAGRGDDTYGPGETVKRDQMAAFITRAFALP
jgi:hypothetical protein